VQKQPDADTVKLTAQIEAALVELKQGLPAGLAEPRCCSARPTSSRPPSAT
jgi:hypothetical protein